MSIKSGKGVKLLEGNDVTIVSTGHLVWESIIAAKELRRYIFLRTGTTPTLTTVSD